MKRFKPFPLMVLGMIALMAALISGLMRLGWGLPVVRPGLAELHGPLMISGFLGTLISLERAVALQRWWTYAAPLLTGLGAVSLVANLPGTPGSLLMTLGSGVMVAIFVLLLRLQPTFYTVIMGIGAVAWFIGNVLWLAGWPIPRFVLWWAGFLILTIMGERLELSRLVRLTSLSRLASLAATGVFLAGMVWTSVSFEAGVRLAGIGMLALTLWLARHDIARRTIRQPGLTRYISVCLLSGYVWLGVGGALAVAYGGAEAGPQYDAMLHAVFLGFVFAMIFGHAPIIFPAVLGLMISFRNTFYIHLLMLHLTLLLRVAGDVTDWLPGRQWGGLLNVIVLILFLINTGYAILKPAETGRT